MYLLTKKTNMPIRLEAAPTPTSVNDPSLMGGNVDMSNPVASEFLHHSSRTIDALSGLYDASRLGMRSNGKYTTTVISEIELPGERSSESDTLAVVRITRPSDRVSKYALVGLEREGDSLKTTNQPLLLLEEGKPLLLGRGDGANVTGQRLLGRPFSGRVSRKHITVALSHDGTAIEYADTSSNGTELRYQDGSEVEQSERVEWSYTIRAEDAKNARWAREGAAGRARRHGIGRDTQLSEGVYEGSYGGEAITLDYERDPELIDAAIDEVVRRASEGRNGGGVNKGRVLHDVFDVVTERMRYDSKGVEEIFKNDLLGKDGAKISLSAYIDKGVGVCRHQALFTGIILEKLIQRGVLSGAVSVDRNMIRGKGSDRYDGHAWARYVNSRGEVIILDVAQKKIGYLHDLMDEHSKSPDRVWNYARPTDAMLRTVHNAQVIDKPQAQ